MKIYLLAALLLAAVTAILAAPQPGDLPFERFDGSTAEDLEHALRVRRTPPYIECNNRIIADWACHMHCTSSGHRRGYCEGEVCNCYN